MLQEDEELSPQQRELVGIIQASSNYLLRILNDVMLFTKAESNKIVLELKPVCPATLLEQVRLSASDVFVNFSALCCFRVSPFVRPLSLSRNG